jgi:hypothetical protein
VITIARTGLENLDAYVRRFGDNANRAASMTLNDTARLARARLKAQMQVEIRLTESAFTGKRLYVAEYANPTRLQATVRGDKQGYSLSRFSVDKPVRLARSPLLQIKLGGESVRVDRGFFLPAPNGALGLAVRTKGPLTKGKGRKVGKNLYILFGPSPDQMMKRLAPALVPSIQQHVRAEFNRQIARLINNG